MTTEDSSSPAQPPVLCDFCGRNSADAGPMIEGAALEARGHGQADRAHLRPLRRDV